MLDKYGMKNYSQGDTPVTKGDKFEFTSMSQKNLQKELMKDIPYVLAVESLMYVQLCTCPDIAYVIEKLDRCLINIEIDH